MSTMLILSGMVNLALAAALLWMLSGRRRLEGQYAAMRRLAANREKALVDLDLEMGRLGVRLSESERNAESLRAELGRRIWSLAAVCRTARIQAEIPSRYAAKYQAKVFAPSIVVPSIGPAVPAPDIRTIDMDTELSLRLDLRSAFVVGGEPKRLKATEAGALIIAGLQDRAYAIAASVMEAQPGRDAWNPPEMDLVDFVRTCATSDEIRSLREMFR